MKKFLLIFLSLFGGYKCLAQSCATPDNMVTNLTLIANTNSDPWKLANNNPLVNNDGKQIGGQKGSLLDCGMGRVFTYLPIYNDKVFYYDQSQTVNSFIFSIYPLTRVADCSGRYIDYGIVYNLASGSNTGTPTVCAVNASNGIATANEAAYKFIPASTNIGNSSLNVILHGQEHNLTGFNWQNYFLIQPVTITVEQPQWSGLDVLNNICNSVTDSYILSNYFNITQGVTFYLDNTSSTPITTFSPKGLSAGLHKLIAVKIYDNGTADAHFGSHSGAVQFPYSFIVKAAPTITVNPYKTSFCVNDAVYTFQAKPDGGNYSDGKWSGSGIDAAGNFTAANATIGANNLTYSYTDPNTGCTGTQTITVTVNPAPTVTTSNFSVCPSDAPFDLNTRPEHPTPLGGTYSIVAGSPAAALSGSTFYPANASTTQPTTIAYTYTDGNSCPVTQNFTISIITNNNFSVGNDYRTTCNTSAVINLNAEPGVSPNDGSITWSGTGVLLGRLFDPSQVPLGNNILTATFNSGACIYTKQIIYNIQQGTIVTMPPDTTVCLNSGDFYITGARPTGGTFSDQSNLIDPQTGLFHVAQAGVGQHQITYSVDNGTCVSSKNMTITVISAQIVSILTKSVTTCASAGVMTLPNTNVNGGTWRALDGDYFIGNNQVDVNKMSVGDNRMEYSYTDPSGFGCTTKDTMIYHVLAPPVLTKMNDFYVCLNGGKVALVASPSGGVWSGTGVNNNTGAFFDPSLIRTAGVYPIIYTYTDQTTGCSNTATTLVTVEDAPNITTMPDTAICISSGLLQLYANPNDGTGVWSGNPGISGTTFDPQQSGVGTFQITFTYTNSQTGCSASQNIKITVRPAPGAIQITGDTVICEGSQARITASATNASNFEWLINNNVVYTGTTFIYTVTQNTVIGVRSKPVNAGDCPSDIIYFNLIDNTPKGTVTHNMKDTLNFGDLYSSTSNIIVATGGITYSWDFGDGGTSFQQNGNHYYYKAGVFVVKLKAVSDNGCSLQTVVDTVYVKDQNGIIPDSTFTRGDGMDGRPVPMKIYPTTFKNVLTVEYNLTKAQNIALTFINQGGVIVKTETLEGQIGNNKKVYSNIEQIFPSNGNWVFIKVKSADGTINQDFKLFKL
jgi:hypothetical protein